MRKAKKKQLLDMADTLEKSYFEMKKIIRKNDFQAVSTLIAQCREFAIAMQNAIDGSEGKGTEAVHELKRYCDMLAQISTQIVESDKLGIGNLKKQIVAVQNSIQNGIPEVLEIAFFPYKASMFDSLESIWLAAKDDPNCECYVVPVPYYDKKSDRTLGAMHYEGDQFPEYVPITFWQNYDPAVRKPDIVFFHNPYDANNLITSIHPSFYAEELRKHTDMLVYIPYFVVGANIPEYLCINAGTFYANKVVVQSEQVRKDYIKVLEKKAGMKHAASKIVAIGSPKIDKIITSIGNRSELPAAWNQLINGRKAILFNTSLGNFLADSERYVDKLRLVLSQFETRQDLVLWWRPHPLSEAAYATMRPWLLEKYNRIVKEYVRKGYGIFDDSPDVNRAMEATCAYIGDASTSMVNMFGITGKPLYLNSGVENSDSGRIGQLHTRFMTGGGQYIWTVADNFPGIYRMDPISGIADRVMDFDSMNYRVQELIYYNGKLFVLPTGEKKLIEYDTGSGKISRYEIGNRDNMEDDIFHCIHNHQLYLFPNRVGDVICLNLDTGELTKNGDLGKLLSTRYNLAANGFCKEKCLVLGGTDFAGVIWLAVPAINGLVSFTPETGKYEIHNFAGGIHVNPVDVTVGDGLLYVLSHDGSVIVFDPENGQINQFKSNEKKKARRYLIIEYINGQVWLFPYLSERIITIDPVTGKRSEIKGDTKIPEYLQENRAKFIHSCHLEGKVFLSLEKTNHMLCIDKGNGAMKWIETYLSEPLGDDVYDFLIQNAFSSDDGKHIYGSWLCTMEYFLEKALDEPEKYRTERKKAFRSLFHNADGSAGKSILEAVIERL